METSTLLRICLAVICTATAYGQDPTVTIVQTEPATWYGTKKMTTVRDTDVTLSCYVENLPYTATVRWQWVYNNNQGIVQTQLISKDTAVEDNTRFSIEKPTDFTWRLRIKSIQVTNEGNYTCFVQTTRENIKFDNRTVDVKVPPTLDPEQTSTDSTAKVGENVDLMCNATGRPQPTIEWTRLGGALLPIGEEKFMGSVMKIRGIRPEYRGTYKCLAYNSVGRVSRNIKLSVKFKPIIKSEGQRDDLVYQAVGYRTDLQCIAEAHPFPKDNEVRWMKDGVSITSTTGRQEVNLLKGAFGRLTYELIIHGVEKQDYGTYKCMISNSEGDTIQEIVLKEVETPQASVKLGRVITGAESRQFGAASQLYVSIATALMCLVTALLHHV